jgi:hydrogenase expression/formation protein HypE
MSKFSLDVLNQYVYPFIRARDPDIILGSAFGEDVALTRVGGDILVSHVDPIVGAIENIGWLAVHVACNDIATSGARPRWILLLVLVPDMEEVKLLGQIMQDVNRAADELEVSIIGGHTGYSSGISRPLVAVTALATMGGSQPVRSSGASLGDHVLVTKGVGLEGTAILAQDFADVAIELGLSHQDLAEARHLLNEVSVVPEALALAKQGVTSMHDVTRGGLLETMLEIAYLSDVSLRIDGSQIPGQPVVARFAQAFSFDPLKMISSGTLVATVPEERIPGASRALKDLGLPCADIGQVVQGKGVTLLSEGKTMHYDEIRCEEDELTRMWTRYPRNG